MFVPSFVKLYNYFNAGLNFPSWWIITSSCRIVESSKMFLGLVDLVFTEYVVKYIFSFQILRGKLHESF